MKYIVLSFLLLFTLLCPNISFAHHADTEEEQLIIINKKLNKLAFYDHGVLVKTFSVATGRSRSLTPEGVFKVIKLQRNMPYYKKNIPGGSPNNPLGDRWIGLDVPGTGGYTYGVHGTNAEWSIGSYASDGCVRMLNADVRWLYSKLHYQAKVVIISSPESFDAIALKNGYTLAKEMPFAHKLTLFHPTPMYQNEHFHSTLYPNYSGAITTLKKKGNWIQTTLNGSKQWIYTNKYALGPVTKKKTSLFLATTEQTYRYPNADNPAMGELSNGFFLSFEETTDGWYHVLSQQDGDVWIHPSS